jgi:hypothetical protein
MEAKSEMLQGLRSYLFDYILGILWLLCVAMLVGSADWIGVIESRISEIEKLPDFVVGFVVVIAGVVIPYCASILVRPITLKIMNLFLHRQRGFHRWRWQKSPAAKLPQIKPVEQAAVEYLRGELNWPGNLTWTMRLTALYALHPRLAAQIEKGRDDLEFRAAAVLPTTILFALLAYRVTPVWPLIVSLIVGLTTFSVATWTINKSMDNWWACLNIAVLSAAKTRKANQVKENLTNPSS